MEIELKHLWWPGVGKIVTSSAHLHFRLPSRGNKQTNKPLFCCAIHGARDMEQVFFWYVFCQKWIWLQSSCVLFFKLGMRFCSLIKLRAGQLNDKKVYITLSWSSFTPFLCFPPLALCYEQVNKVSSYIIYVYSVIMSTMLKLVILTLQFSSASGLICFHSCS